MPPAEKIPRVFLSYSWDDEPHRIWVRHFAERLVHFGLDVRLDQWHAQYGDDLSQFMEQEVSKADFVVAVCTPKFAQKANERIGGAGYEQQIITADVVTGRLKGCVIPVLRPGDLTTALPTYLKGTKAIDLRDDARLAEAAEDVARKVFNRPRYAPPTPASVPELPTQTRTPLPGSPSPLVASSAHHEKEEQDKGVAIEEAHFVEGERKSQATAGDKVRGEKDEQEKTERRVPAWIWVASVALVLGTLASLGLSHFRASSGSPGINTSSGSPGISTSSGSPEINATDPTGEKATVIDWAGCSLNVKSISSQVNSGLTSHAGPWSLNGAILNTGDRKCFLKWESNPGNPFTIEPGQEIFVHEEYTNTTPRLVPHVLLFGPDAPTNKATVMFYERGTP
jgi:hypothetical protein